MAVAVAHALETVVLVGPALLHEVQVEDLAVVGDARASGAEVRAEVVVGGLGSWSVRVRGSLDEGKKRGDRWGNTDLGFKVLDVSGCQGIVGEDIVNFENPASFELLFGGLAIEGFAAFFNVLDEC